MNINYTYPKPKRKKQIRRSLKIVTRYLFIFSGFITLTLNAIVGGSAWSLVVVYSMYFAWNSFINTDLVEYNLISQSIKFIANSCILLILLSIIYKVTPLIENVVPYIAITSVIVMSILYLSDMERQKRNLFPILLFVFVTVVAAGIYVITPTYNDWEMPVMGIMSLSFLILCLMSLRGEFLRELRKRFHL